MPSLKLWEAVALIFEVDPSALDRRSISKHSEHQFHERGFPDRVRHEEFEEALLLASRCSNREAGPIEIQKFQVSGSSRADAEVLLPQVVSFFITLGWPKLPAELQHYGEINRESKALNNDISTKERNSLLKLVLGMAMGAYRYNSSDIRSETAKEIAGDCANAGIKIDEDTVRKYLREAAQRVDKT